MEENKETFFNRINPFFSQRELQSIHLGYTLAKFVHRWQIRQELDCNNQPIRYFEHCRRTAIILIDEFKIYDRDMIVSALLHDSLEDCPKDISAEMLEHCFGESVTKIVKLLSKVPKEGYVDRLKNCNRKDVYIIKACDKLDNFRHMDNCSAEFKAKQHREYVEKFEFLANYIKENHNNIFKEFEKAMS